MAKIRVAVVGVGNVSSALIQAIYSKRITGLWHQRVGGYEFNDIEVVSAYDVDRRKIGLTLSEGIMQQPNVGPRFVDIRKLNIEIMKGIINDTAPANISENLESTDSIVDSLKESKADIALNLIPSGMPRTSLSYAEQCLRAGVSLVNCTPSEIAQDRGIQAKFRRAKLIVAGDDLMSQFGGTAFHKGILDFIVSRGIKLEKSYQLDVGGGNETLNTISEDVKMEKREIKTQSIASEVPYKFATVAGTTDYVDYMNNNRTSYFWISGKGLFSSEIGIDIYLRTNDGANAVNVLLDVIRAVSYSIKRKQFGTVPEINEFGFKKLAKQVRMQKSHEVFGEKFVK